MRERYDRDYPETGPSRSRELVLPPNTSALILDRTKGNVDCFVGPYKTDLSGTDQAVVYNEKTKTFDYVELGKAIKTHQTAPEGWYLVLKNPASQGDQPSEATRASAVPLDIGKKVNLPGPISIAMWPGQMCRVVQGHTLRSNEYLVVRVYDEMAARVNWGEAVMKKVDDSEIGVNEVVGDDLSMGKLMIIKGTEVSFYIPPTGIEVVKEESGDYVRDAVSLELLEYCILLDENGDKRYVKGSDVVFPKPTEVFIKKEGRRKFRAIELNEISGIYVKVIADYEEDEVEYKSGDELFITGKEQAIYFPREEHAIIKYDDKEVHYATAVPPGEGRYVLNRLSGEINLMKGPDMLLPDPREEVMVRRILDPRQVKLMFPGNTDALEYNKQLAVMNAAAGGRDSDDWMTENVFRSGVQSSMSFAERGITSKTPKKRATGFESESLRRKQSYTQPRMVTLDTKYDGVVAIDIWTGYAINVVSRSGVRSVVMGPTTRLLEYDETLEAMELSTGTPKSSDHTIKTSYLRVLNNSVSDVVNAVTADLCEVQVQLAYVVDFEGDKEKWFNVENYVQFLVDHMRSMIRNTVKQIGIEKFHKDHITIIRDLILGEQNEEKDRRGYQFPENGMRVKDVKIGNMIVGDSEIGHMLRRAQNDTVKQTLELAAAQRSLELTREKEAIAQEVIGLQEATNESHHFAAVERLKRKIEQTLLDEKRDIDVEKQRLEHEMSEQETLDKISDAEIDRRKAKNQAAVLNKKELLEVTLAEIAGKGTVFGEKMKAISPHLIKALQTLGDKKMAGELTKNLSPLAILGGESVADVFSNILKGTVLGNIDLVGDTEDEED